MNETASKRRLLWYGALLILLGLLTGVAMPALKNPRLGLSAHVGGVLNGMLIVLLALIEGELHLSAGIARAARVLWLVAMYAIWAFTLLGGAFGTSKANPIAGAGYAGAAWQEALVLIGLSAGGVAALVACALILYGLRARAG